MHLGVGRNNLPGDPSVQDADRHDRSLLEPAEAFK